MAWTNPTNPVPLAVITAAYAIANFLEQIRHLRVMTGNADPPGSSYALVSDSTVAASWKKIPADALAAGAVTTSLGYTPVNRAGDTMSGALTLNNSVFLLGKDTGGASQFLAVVGGDDVIRLGDPQMPLELLTSLAVTLGNSRYLRGRDTGGTPVDLAVVGGDNIVKLGALTRPLRLHSNGSIDLTDGVNVWTPVHSGNIASQTVSHAATATNATNATNAVNATNATNATTATTATTAVNATNATTAVNATNATNAVNATAAVTATNASQLGGRTASATPAANAIPIANGAGSLDAWVTASSGDAVSVAGRVPTATPTANAIPISDGAGKLDAWVTPAAFSIPSGLGCWVRTAAEIPAGFVRETSLDGVLLVGAGTTFGQTFNQTQSYGTSWAHAHADTGHSHGSAAHSHGASSLSVGGTTGGPSASGGTASGTPPPSFATDAHTHDAGSLDVGGSTDGASLTTNPASALISTVTWLPPMRAVVWARKT